MIGDAIFFNMFLAVFFMALIVYLDRYEKEAPAALAIVFFLSIMATFLFAVAKGAIIGEREAPLLVSAYIEGGFFEELLKFGILAAIVFRYKGFNESYDLVVYAGVVALGFSFFENIGYFIKSTALFDMIRTKTGDSSLYYQSLSGIMASRIVPAHMLIDISAVYIAGRKGKVTLLNFLAALGTAVLLHGAWNTLAMNQSPWFIFFLFLLTITSVGSLLTLSAKSVYLQRYRKVKGRIESCLFLLDHAESDIGEDERRAYGTSLRGIRKSLSFIKYLRGTEQKAIYELIERKFPPPEALIRAERSGDASAGLAAIAESLKGLDERKFDWSYYVILVFTLASASLAAIFLISLISLIS